MEMLQAHAMVPEGAGGGSIYRRPKAANGPQLPDTSYTLPARTALAAGAAAGEAATAAGGVPVSGSDMELTGEAAAQEQVAQMQAQAQVQDQGLQTEPEEPRQQQPQQQQHQQARRQSLQPAAGRVAHAAGGPGLRPASAESQVQPQVVLAAQQQVQRQAAARRMTIAPVPAGAGTAGGARRVSAPPAPTDRELHFTSVSTTEGHGHLAVVPEDQPFGSEQDRAGSAAQQQPQQHRPQEEEPPFEFPQPPAPAPAPSQLTAPTAPAAARGGAPTPGSMPPRELAITALTGLVATPIRGGFYRYADQASGYIFELWPAPPDSAGGWMAPAHVLWVGTGPARVLWQREQVVPPSNTARHSCQAYPVVVVQEHAALAWCAHLAQCTPAPLQTWALLANRACATAPLPWAAWRRCCRSTSTRRSASWRARWALPACC